MVKKLLVVLFSLSVIVKVTSQDKSIFLDTLEVQSSYISQVTTHNDLISLSVDETYETLDRVLNRVPSVYFKTYGNNQLSTIAFRGTSAFHTNVLWHGIPVNSPTLGQTDFSLWPTWLMSSITVQPGSTGSLFGSGSVGGSVLIDDFNNLMKDNNGFEFTNIVGSFGSISNGLEFKGGNKKLRLATVVFRSSIQNNFQYRISGTDTKQTQKNASALSHGLKQSAQLDLGKHRLSIDAILTSNDREIQPSVTNNETGDDEIKTTNSRVAFEHLYDFGVNSLSTVVGFNHDNFLYNKSERTRSNQFSLIQRLQGPITKGLYGQIGYLLNQSYAQSDNYQGGPSQTQADIFASGTWDPNEILKFIVSIRQSTNDSDFAPVTPSITSEMNISNWSFSLRYGHGYRYPTINDRFWRPGGNKSLKPETSKDLELSIGKKFGNEGLRNQLRVSVYRIWSSNWIIWMPNESNIWSPDNIQNVRITGFELSDELNYQKGDFRLKSNLSASITYSTNRSTFLGEDFIGNQLPYVPYFLAFWSKSLQWRNWSIEVDQSYTGRRYSTLDNTESLSVDDFYLVDFGMSWRRSFKETLLEVYPVVRNIFNTYFENLNNRAMPGRNYAIELTIKI